MFSVHINCFFFFFPDNKSSTVDLAGIASPPAEQQSWNNLPVFLQEELLPHLPHF